MRELRRSAAPFWRDLRALLAPGRIGAREPTLGPRAVRAGATVAHPHGEAHSSLVEVGAHGSGQQPLGRPARPINAGSLMRGRPMNKRLAFVTLVLVLTALLLPPARTSAASSCGPNFCTTAERTAAACRPAAKPKLPP